MLSAGGRARRLFEREGNDSGFVAINALVLTGLANFRMVGNPEVIPLIVAKSGESGSKHSINTEMPHSRDLTNEPRRGPTVQLANLDNLAACCRLRGGCTQT